MLHICLANVDMSHQLAGSVYGVSSYAKLATVKTFTCLKIAI